VISLFVVASLNAFFAYFVLRGGRNIINILFSLIAISVSLWALNLAFFITTKNLDKALINADLYYIAAAAIPVLFFYFSLFFLGYKKPVIKYLVYLVPFFILVIAFIFDKNLLLKEVYFGASGKNVSLNITNYLVYSVYFLFYVILSYINLLKSYYFVQNNLEKKQLRFIIIGTSVAYLLGMVFNLFLPIIGN